MWAIDDPAAAIGVVPAEFQGAAEPGGGATRRARPTRPALSSAIFTNNIRVTFLAIAGGIFAGLGTAAVTIFNGGFIGAIVGLTIENGSSGELLRFVLPHGVLELSCIAVAAAAGLRIGWALVEPGTLTRGESLRREARPAMEIVLGTMPWLVLAGLVEGFVTRRRSGPRRRRSLVGGGLGVAVLGAGARGAAAQSRARRLGPEVGAHAGGGERAGGRLEHARPGALEPVRDAGAGGEDVERDRLAVDVAGVAGGGRELGVEVGVADGGDDHHVAAREHRHGVDERPRGGLLEQVAEDHDQRALGALDGLERELVVGVDGARLEVEQRAHDGVAAGAPRRQAAADPVVERDDAAAVADHVGDERDGDRGVDRRVEPRAVRRAARPSGGRRRSAASPRGPARRGTGCSSAARCGRSRAS